MQPIIAASAFHEIVVWLFNQRLDLAVIIVFSAGVAVWMHAQYAKTAVVVALVAIVLLFGAVPIAQALSTGAAGAP